MFFIFALVTLSFESLPPALLKPATTVTEKQARLSPWILLAEITYEPFPRRCAHNEMKHSLLFTWYFLSPAYHVDELFIGHVGEQGHHCDLCVRAAVFLS